MRLHHVQVASPPGGEDEARRFYAEALGLTEVDKPADPRVRRGCWFRDPQGGAEIHVGVEDPFRPARKAHPALLVEDLEGVATRLEAGGFEVDRRERTSFPGYLRLHTFDAHGNRVELLSTDG